MSSRTDRRAHRLRFPHAVVSDDRRLIVADTSEQPGTGLGNDLPRTGAGVPADTVLAQPDLDAERREPLG